MEFAGFERTCCQVTGYQKVILKKLLLSNIFRKGNLV